MLSNAQDDIYRGGEVEQQVVKEPAPSILSTSTSSSSFLAGVRIGAIAAKLELAISKWAKHVRRNSSTTSISSSTSSLSSRPKSQLTRRRRSRSSVSSLRTFQSDREIAQRITRLKVLRQSRQIPRAFTLYLPPDTRIEASSPSSDKGNGPRVISTTSLSAVLIQIETAMRTFERQRHHRNRHRGSRFHEAIGTSLSSSRPLSMEDSLLTMTRKVRKGKQHEHAVPKLTPVFEVSQTKRQAWFLDVANPTWADLQAIGKLLHIHPLTLEDILQQDPREKVDIFPNLGYYFISFRTIENQATRERIQREAGLLDPSGNNQGFDEGSIGEANVYLTIFNDGICCFHFTDVSEHTDRVRNKMLRLEKDGNMSSDWIAHAILDSIVDSFFPFLGEIEQEVLAIDQTVFANRDSLPLPTLNTTKIPLSGSITGLHLDKTEKSSTTDVTNTPEKQIPTKKIHTRFASPRLTLSFMFRRAKRKITNKWKGLWMATETSGITQTTLRRVARVKKLIAVLGRLLSSKSDVMTGIRKRLMKALESRYEGKGINGHTEEAEIAIYMGDIQDHILALQLTLAHNERMINQSQPAYMSLLRSDLELTKGEIDKRVLHLTIVTLAVLLNQTLTGIFSMNVDVPSNLQEPGGKYVVFGLILAGSAFILASIFGFVHYWWKKAEWRRSP